MHLDGNVLLWIQSYVTDCTQSIQFNITSGVRQGTDCGPLPFNLFINDINKAFIHSQFLVFVDEIKIFDDINKVFDTIHLQSS